MGTAAYGVVVAAVQPRRGGIPGGRPDQLDKIINLLQQQNPMNITRGGKGGEGPRYAQTPNRPCYVHRSIRVL